VVRPGELDGDLPADRADEDHPAAGAAQQREHRLRDGDLTDHVDLELLAQLVDGKDLQRAGDARSGIVDDGVEACVTEPLLQHGRRGRDRVRVGDVEGDHVQSLRCALLQRYGVVRIAEACENRHAGLVEGECGGGTDTAGRTGQENCCHAIAMPADR